MAEAIEPLMTAEEVAAYLRLKVSTVNQWSKEGKLPVTKVGSLNRYRKADIDSWLSDLDQEATQGEAP